MWQEDKVACFLPISGNFLTKLVINILQEPQSNLPLHLLRSRPATDERFSLDNALKDIAEFFETWGALHSSSDYRKDYNPPGLAAPCHALGYDSGDLWLPTLLNPLHLVNGEA